MTVDQFEALVQAQKPADTPWTPVTDYSFEARKVAEGIHPQLIKDVFQPMKVLDVGCGPGHLVRMLTAIDVVATGGDVTSNRREQCVYLDITGAWEADYGGALMLNSFSAEHADLVICREVLEHLTVLEIKDTLRKLCYAAARFVYVTTRFTDEWSEPHPILSVATSDDLDPTHQTMLCKDFLRVLFVLEGFRRCADLEERMDWKKLNRCLVYERG